MTTDRRWWCSCLLCALLWLGASDLAGAAEIRLVRKKHDPYGAPRPATAQQHVPLRTSFYVELTVQGDVADAVLPESVSISLRSEGGEAFSILKPGRQFAAGYTGRVFPGKDRRAGRTLIAYVDSERKLQPDTTYEIHIAARSRKGASISPKDAQWKFTTAREPTEHAVRFALSLKAKPVIWHGAFFSGFCKPSFCTSSSNRIGSYELMAQVRKTAPQAWSLQRDFWMTGMESGPTLLSPQLPNIVRERETRRITKIDRQGETRILHVEDFFGHQQYGIKSKRPLGGDYHPGDEILIADGKSDARAKVIRVDETTRTVHVTVFDTPEAGWQLDYTAALPTQENADAPGLFPPGGCFLRKFRPAGTPMYYWGRLDHEWDLAHRRFGHRLMPNFADAPGDLAIDGRNWTTAKDYAQLHGVVRAITGHIIDRYGGASLDFPWSVFNEPDLIGHFWRSDWNELQKFYDYTIDAILRAFEDRGYDSRRVFVGGLELGGIFGTNLRLRELLAHCSPRAQAKGALPVNAAYADKRLAGKRSNRVEQLCSAHNGQGSPCDFVSVHSYNTSQLMAAKLARAKEMALEIDAEYYERLWVNSHESCPGWNMPPDPAFADSYLGNGYFPTWCADVVRRQLQQAAADPRYGFGETILTFWPWPNSNFGGGNACTRTIQIDDDGNGTTDRSVSVAMPILHFLGLVGGMAERYWVLPERIIGAHVVSGFASRTGRDVRMLLYAHDPLDTEARSGQSFEVAVDLAGFDGKSVQVTEYRFDKEHNSYYRLGRRLREQRLAESTRPSGKTPAEVESAIQLLDSKALQQQRRGLQQLDELGTAAKPAVTALVALVQKTDDPKLKADAIRTLRKIIAPRAYPTEVIRKVQDASTLQKTRSYRAAVDSEGHLKLKAPLDGNGASFLVIEKPVALRR